MGSKNVLVIHYLGLVFYGKALLKHGTFSRPRSESMNRTCMPLEEDLEHIAKGRLFGFIASTSNMSVGETLIP
jgi:hypothetical protein